MMARKKILINNLQALMPRISYRTPKITKQMADEH
jgi:hypothetical protein